MPGLLLRALGPVNPMMKGLAEMSDQFDEPFALDASDTSKYEATSGAAGTPPATALADTISWYRTQ